MKPKIAVILGTRPEIIKLFTVIDQLRRYFEVSIIHTGQHYSKDLNQNQLDIFKLKVDTQLITFDANATIHLSNMIAKVSEALSQLRPTGVVVHGDTNSTISGALAARKLNIPIAHIESGARCFNKDVPEEQNRIVADHFSTLNFCYDKESKQNLKREGITKNVFEYSNTAYSTCHYINQLYLKGQKEQTTYVLATLHRSENTDCPQTIKKLVDLLNHAAKDHVIKFPIHPRTQKILEEQNLTLHPQIEKMAPVDYLDFLKLIKGAKFILSDSGGVVDESIYFNIPLIILRHKTERNLLVKKNKIKRIDPTLDLKKIIVTFNKIVKNDLLKMKKVKINFDVNASAKIAKKIAQQLAK